MDAMRSAAPSDVYDVIESWWGTEFNDELVARMAVRLRNIKGLFRRHLRKGLKLGFPMLFLQAN